MVLAPSLNLNTLFRKVGWEILSKLLQFNFNDTIKKPNLLSDSFCQYTSIHLKCISEASFHSFEASWPSFFKPGNTASWRSRVPASDKSDSGCQQQDSPAVFHVAPQHYFFQVILTQAAVSSLGNQCRQLLVSSLVLRNSSLLPCQGPSLVTASSSPCIYNAVFRLVLVHLRTFHVSSSRGLSLPQQEKGTTLLFRSQATDFTTGKADYWAIRRILGSPNSCKIPTT